MSFFLALLSGWLLGYAGFYMTGNYVIGSLVFFGVMALYASILQMLAQTRDNMYIMHDSINDHHEQTLRRLFHLIESNSVSKN